MIPFGLLRLINGETDAPSSRAEKEAGSAGRDYRRERFAYLDIAAWNRVTSLQLMFESSLALLKKRRPLKPKIGLQTLTLSAAPSLTDQMWYISTANDLCRQHVVRYEFGVNHFFVAALHLEKMAERLAETGVRS